MYTEDHSLLRSTPHLLGTSYPGIWVYSVPGATPGVPGQHRGLLDEAFRVEGSGHARLA
jgi:hypothetical protein